jgi:hypothetical protein
MTEYEWLHSWWAIAYIGGITLILAVPTLRLRYWRWRNDKERARIARLIRRIEQIDRDVQTKHERRGDER